MRSGVARRCLVFQTMEDPLAPALRVKRHPIDGLTFLPGNPKQHDIEAIKYALTTFGQRYPIIVRDSEVVAGNGRLEAMIDLGWTEVAVTDADDLTDAEAAAYALADNRTQELGGYDEELLAQALREIDSDLVEVTGYDDAAIAALLDSIDTTGFEPEPADSQPRLDELTPVECPNCGHSFQPK